MVQRHIELINGVRPERIAYFGPIKRDPDNGGVIRPVIGDVGEVKAINRMPHVRRERAGHAPKLAGPFIVIARASRARIRLVRRRSQRKERVCPIARSAR